MERVDLGRRCRRKRDVLWRVSRKDYFWARDNLGLGIIWG